MLRTAEIGLISAMVLSVLAFGGTEAPYFPIAQVLILGVAILMLLSYRPVRANQPEFPVWIPLILVTLILLQITPLPASLVQLLGSTNAPPGASSARFSVAPHETILNLGILLTYLAVFYLTLVVCQHRDGSKHLVFALLGLGTFEACCGLVQYLTGWQGFFTTYVRGNELEVATGTYINPDHFAGLLEMILPFALAMSFYQYEKITHEQAESEEPARGVFKHDESHKLLLWLFLAILLVIAIIASQSRMGIISAVASSLLLFSLLATSRWRRSNAVFVVALFIAAAIAAVIWIGPEPVIGRFQTIGQEYAAGGQNRLGIWMDTLQLIGQHPFLGIGLGTFTVCYPSEQTSFVQHFDVHANEDYL
jgi:O-antigen ligase